MLAALHDDSLTATMLHWIHYAVVSRFDAEEQEIIIDSTNPKEMQAMLTRSIDRAMEKLRNEGIILGIEQGIEQGMQQGIEQGMQQGIQQGMEQGMQQGMQQGKTSFFEYLIRQKFGLPQDYQQRIRNASSEELDRWGLRILTAQNIDEVFDS